MFGDVWLESSPTPTAASSSPSASVGGSVPKGFAGVEKGIRRRSSWRWSRLTAVGSRRVTTVPSTRVDSNELSFEVSRRRWRSRWCCSRRSPPRTSRSWPSRSVPEAYMGEVNRDLNLVLGPVLGMDFEGTTPTMTTTCPRPSSPTRSSCAHGPDGRGILYARPRGRALDIAEKGYRRAQEGTGREPRGH